MSIQQKLVLEKVEVSANNLVQVFNNKQYIDDSTNFPSISSAGYVTNCIAPGEDYSQEEPKVQAICQAVHTPEVVAQYQAQLEVNSPQVLTPAE